VKGTTKVDPKSDETTEEGEEDVKKTRKEKR
jgi:hypothetical protein